MKLSISIIIVTLLFISLFSLKCFAANSVALISKDEADVMINNTWHPDCPVPIADLRRVKVRYWDFHGKKQWGTIVVNKDVADDVAAIFKEIYAIKFPIERMDTMENFHGDDNAAMAVNNSSAFNCRPNVTHPNEFSLHSYGRAIDINTLINPYVKGEKVLPPEGRAHLDRNTPQKGKIVHGDKVYQIFAKYGWEWGGDWPDRQDYQHFQKK